MIHFILSYFFVFFENNLISDSYEHQIAAKKQDAETGGVHSELTLLLEFHNKV